MLKIDVENSRDKLKFILCGKLVEPWVAELKAEWQQRVQGVGNRRIIVDLKQTTNIDASGLELLAQMREAGASFVTSGVLIKYLVKRLPKGKRK
jgi:anti-anti-sigma regulatory factor